MSCMRQNFRLFHVSNLSVRNFRIFLLMYTGLMRSGNLCEPEIDAPCCDGTGGAVLGVCTLMPSSLEQTSIKDTTGLNLFGTTLFVLRQWTTDWLAKRKVSTHDKSDVIRCFDGRTKLIHLSSRLETMSFVISKGRYKATSFETMIWP